MNFLSKPGLGFLSHAGRAQGEAVGREDLRRGRSALRSPPSSLRPTLLCLLLGTTGTSRVDLPPRRAARESTKPPEGSPNCSLDVPAPPHAPQQQPSPDSALRAMVHGLTGDWDVGSSEGPSTQSDGEAVTLLCEPCPMSTRPGSHHLVLAPAFLSLGRCLSPLRAFPSVK